MLNGFNISISVLISTVFAWHIMCFLEIYIRLLQSKFIIRLFPI